MIDMGTGRGVAGKLHEGKVVIPAPDNSRVELHLDGNVGVFRLTYLGQTTAPLPWDTNAAKIQDALNALPNLSGSQVSQDPNTGHFIIQLPGILDRGDLQTPFNLTHSGNNTTSLAWDAPPNIIQAALANLPSIAANQVNVTYADHGSATYTEDVLTIVGGAGTYKLSHDNKHTADINWNSTPGDIKTKLGSLSSIESNKLTVTYANPGTAGYSTSTLTVDAEGGTFTLSHNSNTTTDLAWDADANAIRNAAQCVTEYPKRHRLWHER